MAERKLAEGYEYLPDLSTPEGWRASAIRRKKDKAMWFTFDAPAECWEPDPAPVERKCETCRHNLSCTPCAHCHGPERKHWEPALAPKQPERECKDCIHEMKNTGPVHSKCVGCLGDRRRPNWAAKPAIPKTCDNCGNWKPKDA